MQTQRATITVALAGDALSDEEAAVALSGITAVVTLPDGVRYIADSARLDGAPIAAGGSPDDGTLSFRLGDTNGTFARALTFEVDIVDDAPAASIRAAASGGDVAAEAPATVKALAMFDADGKHNARRWRQRRSMRRPARPPNRSRRSNRPCPRT